MNLHKIIDITLLKGKVDLINKIFVFYLCWAVSSAGRAADS